MARNRIEAHVCAFFPHTTCYRIVIFKKSIVVSLLHEISTALMVHGSTHSLTELNQYILFEECVNSGSSNWNKIFYFLLKVRFGSVLPYVYGYHQRLRQYKGTTLKTKIITFVFTGGNFYRTQSERKWLRVNNHCLLFRHRHPPLVRAVRLIHASNFCVILWRD